MNAETTEPVRFRCTACGGCCGSGPDMSFVESLRYCGYFAIAATIHAARPDSAVGAMMAALGAPEVETAGGTWIARLGAKAIGLPSDARCPALDGEGRRCRIHAERPASCANLPLQHHLGTSQHDAVEDFASLGLPCDWGPDAPILVDGLGVPADTASADLGRAALYEGFDGAFLRSVASGPARGIALAHGFDAAAAITAFAGSRTSIGFDPEPLYATLAECGRLGILSLPIRVPDGGSRRALLAKAAHPLIERAAGRRDPADSGMVSLLRAMLGV